MDTDMTDHDAAASDGPGPRRPRIALMGEFSAGKSTLANLLLGEARSPVKVTATQLPPVWYVHGAGPMVRVDLDGEEHVLGPDGLAQVTPDETAHVRVPIEAEVLELCDIIDLPGISDPNMSADVWGRALDLADGVIWCTHATQAWRQSEHAVWEEVDPALHRRSLLLLTRIDKIASERDRTRIVARVSHEVEGLFRDVFPIALTDALRAEDDPALWSASGAEAFADSLLALVQALGREIAQGSAPADRRAPRVAARSKPHGASSGADVEGDADGTVDASAPLVPPNPFDRLRARAAQAAVAGAGVDAGTAGEDGGEDAGGDAGSADGGGARGRGPVLPRRIAVAVRTPRPVRA